MLRAYRWLLFLYPLHVRAVYGREMLADYARRLRAAQSSRPAGSLRLLLGEILHVVPDAAAERIAALSSHPSFHGRRPPNFGVVRPPNVGKHEWFYATPLDDQNARSPEKPAAS